MTCRDCDYYFSCPNSYKYIERRYGYGSYKEGVEDICRDRHKSFSSDLQKDTEVKK